MLEAILTQMAQTAQAILTLASGVTAEQARWKPDPQSWSILEVVNHLYDEEQSDFRVRLDLILHDPARDWVPIEPEGWVTSRGYNQRDLADSLNNFLLEREKSLTWLGGLGAPDLNASVTTRFGSMRAGDMLASWAAHDILHLRQLVELHYAWGLVRGAPFDPRYAGEW